jgi:hypothetical protein
MKTIEKKDQAAVKRTEELYRTAFSKGVPLHYQDERTNASNEFIQANPDGSEQLVQIDPESRKFTEIRNLLPAGKGHWAYLATLAPHA